MGPTPYHAVVALTGWLADNWGAIDGQLLSTGVDLLTLPFPRQLNIAYWQLVSSTASDKEREKLIAELDWPIPPEEWGTGPEAEAAQNRMAALLDDGDTT